MRHIIFINGVYSDDPSRRGGAIARTTRSIGVYQLKHWMSKFGIKSQVIDFCQWLTVKEMLTLIEHFKGPETVAVGICTSFWPYGSIPSNIVGLVEQLRDKHPSLKIIGGGPNPYPFESFFDKRFYGNAEDELVVWVQEELGRKGRSMFNKKFDITKLDHRFDHTDAIASHEVLPVELGRGCIFKCKFCAHSNLGKSKKTYQREFDFVVDELRWNREQFGVTRVNFVDDTVNEDIDKVRNMATLPKALGFDLNWNGYLRADLVWAHKESPELLYQSGLKSCFFGIETFNPHAGSAVGKGWASKHGKEFLPKLHHELWNSDVRIHLNFIIGLPGETIEESLTSAKWVKEQKVFGARFVALYIYEPNSGNITSEFEKEAPKYGYALNNGTWTSPLMTREHAVQAAITLGPELNDALPLASWELFGLMSIGIPQEKAFSLTRSEMHALPSIQALKFKSDYVKRLLALRE